MAGGGRFAARSGKDVVRLVEENPLGWIVMKDADGPFATAAPVRPSRENDELSALIGHVPRRTRIARCMAGESGALILVLGPHGYISPSWMSDRTQAPTWNFTSAQFVTEVRLVDDAVFLERHLRDLTVALERGRPQAWRLEDMGGRYESLAARVVAFEARIVAGDARFKLGQDENDGTLEEIIQALGTRGETALASLMRDFNSGRS